MSVIKILTEPKLGSFIDYGNIEPGKINPVLPAVNPVPITFVPTPTGNATNRNEFVTDPNGDKWFIDYGGDATLIETDSSVVTDAAILGLEEQRLAKEGQIALTVLAVGQTNTGKVQGVSLGDGNVVEVYASGADFSEGNVLYREFMSFGEPICFTGLANGAIIKATKGFYGASENVLGSNESPMPLLSFGLSFTETFFFAFRNSSSNDGRVWVVNGPEENKITLTDGNGAVQLAQEDIEVAPWGFQEFQLNGDKEYAIRGEKNFMGCVGARMAVPGFYDFRLIMPLTSDGITYPSNGRMSAPYEGTKVLYYTRDGVTNSPTPFSVAPGSPVNIDAVTGAGDSDYEPNGATRFRATGLVAAYSGADTAGLEATPLMPLSGMSQVVAQPFFIDDTGDGGNSGISITSPYTGTAKVYEWNDATGKAELAYTVPITRTNVTIASKEDQYHPGAGQLSNDGQATATLQGDLGAGVVVADVPIMVVSQNGTPSQTPTIRSQNGATTTSIINDDDETLMVGWTPEELKCEIREGQDGLLYKRVIGTGGADTWTLA